MAISMINREKYAWSIFLIVKDMLVLGYLRYAVGNTQKVTGYTNQKFRAKAGKKYKSRKHQNIDYIRCIEKLIM